MLTLFGYSLVALALILFLSRNLSRMTRLLLSLVMLILLNAPTLLAMLPYLASTQGSKTQVPEQHAPSGITRFESWRAHHFSKKSLPYDVEARGLPISHSPFVPSAVPTPLINFIVL